MLYNQTFKEFKVIVQIKDISWYIFRSMKLCYSQHIIQSNYINLYYELNINRITWNVVKLKYIYII